MHNCSNEFDSKTSKPKISNIPMKLVDLLIFEVIAELIRRTIQSNILPYIHFAIASLAYSALSFEFGTTCFCLPASIVREHNTLSISSEDTSNKDAAAAAASYSPILDPSSPVLPALFKGTNSTRYKEIVDQDENNIKAAKKLKKLEKQLREVRAKKLKKDKNKLKSMVEFLAMEEQDVLSLMKNVYP